MKINRRVIYGLVTSLFIITVLGISLNVYTEFNGVPWKHAAIKKDAVEYMKQKYNMEVKVAGSSFNFKFDYYTAKVYNICDSEKQIINVEKHKYFDENGSYKGERLEDNYSKIYWEKRISRDLQEKYPMFFRYKDIAEFKSDIAYHTTSLENGVSAETDANGSFIPLIPEFGCSLDIELNTEDFSEDFLNELFSFVKEIQNTQLKIDLFVTGKDVIVDTSNSRTRTKLIKLPNEILKDITSVEDLKKEISGF